MNWLVFGAGAIGTYIGGSLVLSNLPDGVAHRVVFVDRPEVAAEIRQHGLHLTLEGVDHFIPSPHVAGSVDEALDSGPFDVALFALKSYDTVAALENLSPVIPRLPPLLCLQNGVENEPTLEAALGPGKVIAGSVTSAVSKLGLGQIVLERRRGVGVASGHPLSLAIVSAFTRAGLNAHLFPRASDMKWSKMLTNLLANATSAILDMPPEEIFAHPGLYQLEVAQLREALRVMSASGIQVVDLPGTPVRLLALGVRLPVRFSRPMLHRAVGRGRGAKMPSFHIDLHNRIGKSEVGYLNGAVVRAGERLGIPTPVNSLLTNTLLSLVRGDIPLAAYTHQPDKLIKGLS